MIKIPKMFMGKPIEGSLDGISRKQVRDPPQNPGSSQPQTLNVPAVVNPREYIRVGVNGIYGQPVLISSYELQGTNGLNYENAHKKVLQSGLYVPTPRIFMAHFINVVGAKRNTIQLAYADGASVPDAEVKEMYQHLTRNYRDVFGQNNPVAWTWLNAKFIGASLETIVGLNTDGSLKTAVESMSSHINEDCFVALNFNSHGFPVQKAAQQEYNAGENVYFYHPCDGCVARFLASSVGAYLDCDWGPTDADPSLGVFACAEGAAQKNP